MKTLGTVPKTMCVMADANIAMNSYVHEKAAKGKMKIPSKNASSEKISSTRFASYTASISNRVHSVHSSNGGGHDSASNAEILSI